MPTFAPISTRSLRENALKRIASHRIVFHAHIFRQKCHKIRCFWQRQSNEGSSGGLFSDQTADGCLLRLSCAIRQINRNGVERVSKCVISAKICLEQSSSPPTTTRFPSLPTRPPLAAFPIAPQLLYPPFHRGVVTPRERDEAVFKWRKERKVGGWRGLIPQQTNEVALRSSACP